MIARIKRIQPALAVLIAQDFTKRYLRRKAGITSLSAAELNNVIYTMLVHPSQCRNELIFRAVRDDICNYHYGQSPFLCRALHEFFSRQIDRCKRDTLLNLEV